MKTVYKSQKLEFCKKELKVLLEKLVSGNYHTTAEVVFDHIDHTGVETDLNTELKRQPTLEKFLKAE